MRASVCTLLQTLAIGLPKVLVEKEKLVTPNASSSWCFEGEGRGEKSSSLPGVEWGRKKGHVTNEKGLSVRNEACGERGHKEDTGRDRDERPCDPPEVQREEVEPWRRQRGKREAVWRHSYTFHKAGTLAQSPFATSSSATVYHRAWEANTPNFPASSETGNDPLAHALKQPQVPQKGILAPV